MKIVCESCGAKYSIADDRVAGKVFKIRCKRCSEVIVVHGDQQEAAAASSGAPADQNAIWHVVLDGEQAGPFGVGQISELMNSGRIDWEAYVWAEGFDNWVPMRDVPDLVSQLSGGGAAASSHGAMSGQASMGADPFADPDPGMFGGGGRDLFAAAPEPASPFGGGAAAGGGVVASSPSPRVSTENAMTGARNENSVLFSLKNLQALATGTPSMPPAAAPAIGGGGRAASGFAAGEGSGLIDIRALAAATGVGGEMGASSGGRDDLLSIGSQGGAFGALGSPILAAAPADDDGNKKTVIWAAVAAVAIAAAAAVAIVVVLKQQPAPAPVAVQPPPVAAVPAVPAAAVAAAAVPTAPAAPGTAEPSKDDKAASADSASKSSSGSGSSRRHGSKGGASEGESAPSSGGSAPAEAPAEAAKPAKPSGPRSLDDLLSNALDKPAGAKPAAAHAPAESNLPETPSREQVMSAMGSVKSDVSACSPGAGVATVTVSVAGTTGRVTNATVSGITGPAGSCVAQAVRKAQFPKFKNPVFKVSFPFKL